MSNMRLYNVIAKPHPIGNRIDLIWENPEPEAYPWIKVVRRESTHPLSPEDGYSLIEINALLFTSNSVLAADLDNRVISFNLLDEFRNSGIILSEYAAVSVTEASAKWVVTDYEEKYVLINDTGAISAYRIKNSVSDYNLKSETIYYFTLFPFKKVPLEYALERSGKTASMASGPYNFSGQMYDLLPRIYHRYDTKLSMSVDVSDSQKGELLRMLEVFGSQLDQLYSYAKAMLDICNIYKTDGRLFPLLAQWIGWKTDYNLKIDSQRNEVRNAPAIYKTIEIIPTVESTVKRMSGWESRTKEFVNSLFVSNRPERLNIWQQTRDNASGAWSDRELLSLNFAYEGAPAAACDADNVLWLFYHTYKQGSWNIWYKTWKDGQGWAPSQPLSCRRGMDKHPAAALHGSSLWVFWDSYNEADRKWHINYRKLEGGIWSDIDSAETFAGGTANERKKPCAIDDNAGGLWLFWLERTGSKWTMKYNRHSGASWQLSPAASFPLAGTGDDPLVQEDPFVLFRRSDNSIMVFWARRNAAGGTGEKPWTIAYRIKAGLDPDVSGDWSDIGVLSKDPPAAVYSDREPAAFINAAGNVELFWSSNRSGGYSIWRGVFNAAAHSFENREQITLDPYSQRQPLPVSAGGSAMLLYRSNESLEYQSRVYRATKTMDFRYAGCTTVDTRNTAKIGLQAQFEDIQTYTYDTGTNGKRTDDDWYARDTIGCYLSNDAIDAGAVNSGINRIRNVIGEFMPITDRAVFIPRHLLHTERVYTYGMPFNAESRFINETYQDTLISESEEIIPAPGEEE